MSEEIHQVEVLKNHVQRLITLYEAARTSAELLQTKLQEQEKELEQKDKQIAAWQEKFNMLKMAKTIEATSQDKHEAKIKINKIVREIDRCIAMLNK